MSVHRYESHSGASNYDSSNRGEYTPYTFAHIGRFNWAAKTSRKAEPVNCYNLVCQIVGHRHDALPSALAMHDKAEAIARVQHIAASHLGNLTAPQSAFGGETDHHTYVRRGLFQRVAYQVVGARVWVRCATLHMWKDVGGIILAQPGHDRPLE